MAKSKAPIPPPPSAEAQQASPPPPDAPALPPQGQEAGPPSSNLLALTLALLAVGVGVSIYLVRHKLHVLLDPGYLSSCNLGGAINCDKVNMSGMSELFGLPISLYAIPTYVAQIYLVATAMRAGSGGVDGATGRRGLDIAAGLGLMASVFSLYLALYSSIRVEAYCLYCISLYVVNFGSTALLLAAGSKTVGTAVANCLSLLKSFEQPVLTSVLVAGIGMGVAWLGYDHTKSAMEQSYKDCLDCQMDSNLPKCKTIKCGNAAAPVTVDAAAANQAAAQINQAGAQTNQGAATAGIAPVQAAQAIPSGAAAVGMDGSECGKTYGVLTKEDGWTIYNPCFDEEDLRDAVGPKDAKVTVVKYSDFECPYCKYLAMTMEPVKTKFKDKVRFIMKHYPMNPTCNRYMQGYDKHPNACNAHATGLCAGRQNKFWEMHDKLYANQPSLDPAANRKAAEELGLDMAKYDACIADPSIWQKFNKDIDAAVRAGINGAPRTYINGMLVTGSATTQILEYMVQKALDDPRPAWVRFEQDKLKQAQLAPKPDGSHMIASKTAKGPFFIDPYEASIAKDGRAVSIPDVDPAMASWVEAEQACKQAGKRLCSEEEWVSACSGVPAIDNNTNQQFADDDVEGNMYPYGTFYEAGNCVDQEDKYKGKYVKTGTKDKCRTPAGVFDLAGNIGEWTGGTKETAGLMGGHNNSGERAACNQGSRSFGVGNRNQTTGFRCCADADVAQKNVAASDLKGSDTDLVGKPVPAFTGKDSNGIVIDSDGFKGKVTLVNFFASWCGPCKKEFPELVTLWKEHKSKGFQVVSIGVDREEGRSLEFAKGFECPWGVIADPESELMGKFNVYSMPATFIVDRKGVIQFYDTGFKPEEQLQKLRDAITKQL